MKSTATKTVSAPVEKVWSVLSDHEGMTGWVPGLKSVVTTPGATDPNGLGAIRRISMPGPAPAIVEEVIGYEPSRRLTYKAIGGVPLRNYQGDVELESVKGGTRIKYTISANTGVPLVDGVAVRVISQTLLTMLVRAVNKAA